MHSFPLVTGMLSGMWNDDEEEGSEEGLGLGGGRRWHSGWQPGSGSDFESCAQEKWDCPQQSPKNTRKKCIPLVIHLILEVSAD